jgi:hypothetical protein
MAIVPLYLNEWFLFCSLVGVPLEKQFDLWSLTFKDS